MILTSLADADHVLDQFIGTVPKKGAYKLDAVKQFMASLGDPQNSYHVIHVAGTSGKTSTAYYIEALVRCMGLRTGLTVSPHIDSIEERAQINGSNMPESQYLDYLGEFLDIVVKHSIPLSYFEVMAAFAFWVFKRQAVDVAVVEVGIGGLLDGTNVINNPGKYCVITDIGLDHVEILGDTLEAIAAQKAGIIGEGNPVFMNRQPDAVQRVIKNAAQRHEAPLEIVDGTMRFEAPLPSFQVRNLGLAVRVVRAYARETGLSLTQSMIESVARTTRIPARMETIGYKGRQLILDGAHNGQKIQALVDALLVDHKKDDVTVVVSIGSNKRSSVEEIFAQLARLTTNVYLTSFGSEPDAYHHSIDAAVMAESAEKAGLQVMSSNQSPMQLLDKLVGGEGNQEILITGSYYLFNEIRPYLR